MAATGPAALPEAAALSGLSLQKEFELCKGRQTLLICSLSQGTDLSTLRSHTGIPKKPAHLSADQNRLRLVETSHSVPAGGYCRVVIRRMHVAGAGQLRRALACLTAMSAGATERSQLSSLPCWRRAAAEHVPLATSPCTLLFSPCAF